MATPTKRAADRRYRESHPEFRAKKNAAKKLWDKQNSEHRKRYTVAYRKKNKKRIALMRHAAKLRVYGLTVQEYDRMHANQNGVCAICRRPEVTKHHGVVMRLPVDHNHETGKVRGLVCTRCNPGIGYFQDSPVLLRTAAEYLEQRS